MREEKVFVGGDGQGGSCRDEWGEAEEDMGVKDQARRHDDDTVCV